VEGVFGSQRSSVYACGHGPACWTVGLLEVSQWPRQEEWRRSREGVPARGSAMARSAPSESCAGGLELELFCSFVPGRFNSCVFPWLQEGVRQK